MKLSNLIKYINNMDERALITIICHPGSARKHVEIIKKLVINKDLEILLLNEYNPQILFFSSIVLVQFNIDIRSVSWLADDLLDYMESQKEPLSRDDYFIRLSCPNNKQFVKLDSGKFHYTSKPVVGSVLIKE